ncbi:SIR2-domain-containing protein [Serendipita vermifera]|nr:SIR2-domain-containing protein [Serendipita vermifera]
MSDRVLQDNTLKSIANYLQTDVCNDRVIVLVRLLELTSSCIITEPLSRSVVQGGISTSAGIPDFRSPDTGLYANLAKLNLPYPEAVFDIHYFQLNPQPYPPTILLRLLDNEFVPLTILPSPSPQLVVPYCTLLAALRVSNHARRVCGWTNSTVYTLARDIAPGKFIPTPTHAFIKLLHEKGKLSKCFTQNIDTLERIAGVPPDKIVEAHGSFAASRCITCKTPYDNNQMKEDIRAARVPYCPEPECEGLVKPDIVFFGEGLPPEFAQGLPTIQSAALVIVMGTSLKVHPFALLPNLVPSRGCPRLLLNLEPAGNIGISLRQELRAVSQANNPSGRASPPASPSPSPDQREGSPASTARHGDPLSVPQGTGTVGDNVPAGGAHDLDRQSPAEAAQARTNANVNVTKKEEAIPGGAPLDSEDQDVQWDDEEYEEVDEDDEDEDEWGEDELGGVWLDDVVHLGPCDKSVRELCDLLGWRDELERIWKEGGGREPQKADVPSKEARALMMSTQVLLCMLIQVAMTVVAAAEPPLKIWTMPAKPTDLPLIRINMLPTILFQAKKQRKKHHRTSRML